MGKILSFPGLRACPPQSAPAPPSAAPPSAHASRRPPRFGLARAPGRRQREAVQLDLFGASGGGKVLAFPGSRSLFEQALRDDEAGDQAAARSGYLEAIRAGDRVADACCNLGVLEHAAEDADAAFDRFRQALRREARHWESHYNLGNLYLDAGHYGSARARYEAAVEIDPEVRSAHFNLTLALALEGEYGAAARALERFRTLAPAEEAEVALELLETLRASHTEPEGRLSP